MTLKEVIEKCKKLDPKIWIASYVLISALLLYFYPPIQVAHFEINNSTTIATLENQYRANLTQILGGGAVAIGIYFAWKNFIIAQDNLKVAQESQITERFTRAIDQLGSIDQLGNPAMEIRLGGIYALKRISNESEKDYWPIMEILTAYIRENSSAEISEVPEVGKISSDIQAILTIIGTRKYSFRKGEDKRLELQGICLQNANLMEAHLEGINFEGAHLEGTNFEEAHLEGAKFKKAYLGGAKFKKAHLEKADLIEVYMKKTSLVEAHLEEAHLNEAHLVEETNLLNAHLEGAYLMNAHLEGATLGKAHLEGARLSGAHLEGAYLNEAHLEGANLINAHLEGTNLINAYLEGADLSGTHLEEAYLNGANLEKAILIGTHLEGAKLHGVHLEGAYLNGANLKEAELNEAHIDGADLRGTLDFTLDQLSKVKTLYGATLSEDLCILLEENYPEKYQSLIKKSN